MPYAWPNGGDAAVQENDPAMGASAMEPDAPHEAVESKGVPDVSRGAAPSTSPPESIPEGACVRCHLALMPFERHWKSGKCNRCYNEAQGGAKCDGCGKGLWKCERKLPSRRCCECEAHRCKRCDRGLTAEEVRWDNQYCNRCYNLWKRTTKPCGWCRRGLLLPEFRGGSIYCDPCREAWGRF